MNPSTLLSQVYSHGEIHRYLDWHYQLGIPLVLMCDRAQGHRPARIVKFGATQSAFHVFCGGMRELSEDADSSYAFIGRTPNGGHFMASGHMSVRADVPDCFALSFPEWIDIAQSRDTYRCPAPSSHFVHFGSADPHLNDVVCRTLNLSLGGLAVEWVHSSGNPPPAEGTLTDSAIMQAGHQHLHLGHLRVIHVTSGSASDTVGFSFHQHAPRAFSSLVLGIQRKQPLYLSPSV